MKLYSKLTAKTSIAKISVLMLIKKYFSQKIFGIELSYVKNVFKKFLDKKYKIGLIKV